MVRRLESCKELFSPEQKDIMILDNRNDRVKPPGQKKSQSKEKEGQRSVFYPSSSTENRYILIPDAPHKSCKCTTLGSAFFIVFNGF